MDWTSLTDAAQQLASAFDKRWLDGPDTPALVAENLAELDSAGVFATALTPVQVAELLRIVAGGCGATAFAAAARQVEHCSGEQRTQRGHHYEAAVFLGLAERAYQLAIAATKDHPGEPDPAMLPGTQFAVARMRGALATAGALLDRHLGEPDPRSHLPRYYLAMVAEQVVSSAIEVIGAHPEHRRRGARIWQNLKTGPVLTFSTDLALEHIGKTALGIDPNNIPRWL